MQVRLNNYALSFNTEIIIFIHNYLFSGDLDVLVRKTHLLIENENNNRAERLMNIVARFTAGKRLNLIQRGSYQRRVYLSGLRHNKNANWHYSPYKKFTGTSPGKYLKNFMEQQSAHERFRKKSSCRKRLFATVNPKKKIKTQSEKNTDYGVLADQPEDPVAMGQEVEEVIERLQVFIDLNPL